LENTVEPFDKECGTNRSLEHAGAADQNRQTPATRLQKDMRRIVDINQNARERGKAREIDTDARTAIDLDELGSRRNRRAQKVGEPEMW
jgi:hypothetical protein